MFLGIILNINVDFDQVLCLLDITVTTSRVHLRSKLARQLPRALKCHWRIRNSVLVNSIFPQMKKVSENYPQFGLAPSKMFASLAICMFVCVCVCVCLTIIWCRTFVFSLLSQHVKLKMCKTVYRTWTPTMRKEQRLRVIDNRVLRTIFGPKRNEVAGSGAT